MSVKKNIAAGVVILMIMACSGNQKMLSVITFQTKGIGTYIINVEIGEERHKADFIFDTGSEITALDADFAEKIGIKITGVNEVEGGYSLVKYKKSSGNILTIGQKRLENITFTLLPLGTETNEFGESYRVDGIIGADIMKCFNLAMNFDTSQLTLYNKQTPLEIKGYAEIPFHHTGDYFPRINVTTTFTNGDTLSGEVFFDLGSVNTLVFNKPFAQTHEILKKAPAHILRPANDVSGEEIYHEVIRIKTLSIAEHKMHNLPVDISTATSGVSSYPNYMGMLGALIINRFNFIIDTDKGKIYMKPNKNFTLPFDFPLTTLPLRVAAHGKFIIKQTVKANNGKDEIIKKDSQILSVDGKSFSDEIELWNYMYEQNKEYKLELKTPNGEIKHIIYKVVEMI